jgi:hypothetical protein
MAKYDEHFFEEKNWHVHWSASGPDYESIGDDDEKFDKLYRYILELEYRIEQLEGWK